MASPPRERYVRLRGSGRPAGLRGLVGGTHALWLGSDHLLWVETLGYRERYKRFAYADIQALVVARRSRVPIARVLGLAASAVALPCLALGGSTGLVWGLLAYGPLLLALLVHLLLGPMVTCQLQTAVQVEPLPSLSRVRALDHTLGLLVPRIEQAQGLLTLEALGAAPAPSERRRPAAAMPGMKAAVARAPYRGRAHAVLFLALLADAGLTAVRLASPSGLLGVLSFLCMGLALAALVVGASRHGDRFVTQPLRALTWSALVTLVIEIYALLFYGLLTGVSAAPGFPSASELGGAGGWLMRALLLTSLVVSVAVGAGGLLALSAARSRALRARDPVADAMAPAAGPPA